MINNSLKYKALPLIFERVANLADIDVEHWDATTAFKLIQYSVFVNNRFISDPRVSIHDFERYFKDFGVKEIIADSLSRELDEVFHYVRLQLVFEQNSRTIAGSVHVAMRFLYFKFETILNVDSTKFIISPQPVFDGKFMKFAEAGACDICIQNNESTWTNNLNPCCL